MHVMMVDSTGARSMRKITMAARAVQAGDALGLPLLDRVPQRRRAQVLLVGRAAGSAALATVAGGLMYALAMAGVAKLDDPPRQVEMPVFPATSDHVETTP